MGEILNYFLYLESKTEGKNIRCEYIHVILNYLLLRFKKKHYINCLAMRLHAGAMRKLLYGLCICTEDNPLVKARG